MVDQEKVKTLSENFWGERKLSTFLFDILYIKMVFFLFFYCSVLFCSVFVCCVFEIIARWVRSKWHRLRETFNTNKISIDISSTNDTSDFLETIRMEQWERKNAYLSSCAIERNRVNGINTGRENDAKNRFGTERTP